MQCFIDRVLTKHQMKTSVWLYEREFIIMIYGSINDRTVGKYCNRRK